MKLTRNILVMAILLTIILFNVSSAEVKIGLNYPKTGPYSVQGIDQWRAAQIAMDEINASGGILGEQIEIVWRDSESKPAVATANVTEMIEKDGVKMVFGGSSSGVAIASAKVCGNKNIPFFGTLTYSTATTGVEGLITTFRECYDARMAAKALGSYLKDNFDGKTYFYITADYTWGWTTESSVRMITGTMDESNHKKISTPFPGATNDDFKKALNLAKMVKPDVLVLVLFGKDMSSAVRLATSMGMKSDMQIVVPNLTLGMAEGGGPKVMEGVVGALPWTWQVPYKYNYTNGIKFVEKFVAKYDRYPSTSGASAYSILHEYKAGVELAKSFDTDAIISALEGREYTILKDKQIWREFDHQSIQTVYLVKCKPEGEVLKDKFKLDYFEILSSISGDEASIPYSEWATTREAKGKNNKL